MAVVYVNQMSEPPLAQGHAGALVVAVLVSKDRDTPSTSGTAPAHSSAAPLPGVEVSVTVPVPTSPLKPPTRIKRSVPAGTSLTSAMLVKLEQEASSSLQVRGTRFAQSPVKI